MSDKYYLSESQKKTIYSWKQLPNEPLIIYGSSGVGKTSLAPSNAPSLDNNPSTF